MHCADNKSYVYEIRIFWTMGTYIHKIVVIYKVLIIYVQFIL
jgi:hypothetical protein